MFADRVYSAPTFTSRARLSNPRRFLKRDARTLVLRLIYGPMSTNGNRQEPGPYVHLADWQRTVDAVRRELPTAQWSETRVLALMADMEKQRPQPKRRAIPDGGDDE